nr:BTB/POZ and MATH domain-containing protein 1-like [Aegilops tauschii subsp. strangulata]
MEVLAAVGSTMPRHIPSLPLPLQITKISSSRSRRIITEHVPTTYSFQVTNYLQLKDAGFHACVTSPGFSVGGYNWQIAFYPDDEDGYTSLYLRYLGQATDVRAKCTVSVLGNDGQPPLVCRDTPECVFTPGPGRGYRRFVGKSKLESLSRLGDGRFTIRCVLTVRDVSPSELPGHLERMLRDGRCSDVTFRVGGRKFRAHRALLAARSPVFAKLFGPMPEKGTRRVVKVVDVEPAIFQILLHYIYTGSLPACHDEGGYDGMVMEHLLVAAGKYGLEKLKLMCEEELCRRIDEEALVTTAFIAPDNIISVVDSDQLLPGDPGAMLVFSGNDAALRRLGCVSSR